MTKPLRKRHCLYQSRSGRSPWTSRAYQTVSRLTAEISKSYSSSASEWSIFSLSQWRLTRSALVAQTIVEQQLKDRSIPYTLQYPPPTGRGAASSTSAVAGMIPTICAKVDDLLREGRANDVALPLVHIQLREWWKGGKCEVVTVIQLRHKPALASSETSTGSADHEDISFDPKTSVVRFHARDITRCVPSFLERWERLSKVLVVAGEGEHD